jgi:hypothetical protein
MEWRHELLQLVCLVSPTGHRSWTRPCYSSLLVVDVLRGDGSMSDSSPEPTCLGLGISSIWSTHTAACDCWPTVNAMWWPCSPAFLQPQFGGHLQSSSWSSMSAQCQVVLSSTPVKLAMAGEVLLCRRIGGRDCIFTFLCKHSHAKSSTYLLFLNFSGPICNIYPLLHLMGFRPFGDLLC